MQGLTYNIHDLLKIDINTNTSKGLNAGLKYSFFKSEIDGGNADIVLNIGKFNPSNSGCSILSHKYYVKDNYFYCRDKGKIGKWELEIFGFESGKTVINFHGKNSGVKGKLFPSFLAQEFLIPFIEYKLAKKGYILLHSGAISKGSSAHAFAGRMGSFKTTLIMDFIRRADFKYLGDDRIILKGNRVLCFPISLFLFDFMLGNNTTENRNILTNLSLLYYLVANKVPKNTPIISSANLKSITFLSRTNNCKVTVKKLPLEYGINKLVANNRLELVNSMPESPVEHFYKYVLFYSLIFPDNSLATYWEPLKGKLLDSLKGIPVHEIYMPAKYDINVYNKAYELLKMGMS